MLQNKMNRIQKVFMKPDSMSSKDYLRLAAAAFLLLCSSVIMTRLLFNKVSGKVPARRFKDLRFLE